MKGEGRAPALASARRVMAASSGMPTVMLDAASSAQLTIPFVALQ